MLGKVVLLAVIACAFAQYKPNPKYAPRVCRYKGKTYNVGQKFPAGDNCNTCTCEATGQVSCTEKSCYCIYNGQKYKVGQSFPAEDGCNTCTCGSNGNVGCTKIGCPPPVDVCSKPKDTCNGYLTRWWYNKSTNRCEQYTGCKGKGNNFHSKNACRRQCVKKTYKGK